MRQRPTCPNVTPLTFSKFFKFLVPLAVVTISWAVLFQPGHSAELPPAAKETVDFARDIQPLLAQRCYSCHGLESQESGLRLDLKQRALEGGDGGKILEPGESASSRLVQRLAGVGDEELMPPEGEGTPLTAEQIGLVRAWIDQGADWPAAADGPADGSDHWAFQPLQRPMPPSVANASWVRNPLDTFVLARLEAENIQPAPPADRATLIRRVYLDLLGLPPSPAEVNRFVQDPRPDAYERLVVRLLQSDHYGERWARHWLDLARYADTDGYEKDRARPFAWRYREWVIDALNDDMPFDQFTVAQVAGDMLPDADVAAKIAAGFHRNTLHNTEGGADPEEDRDKKTVDRTNTVGTIWLGLTVGCAQCHSHKYDPITQREYFSLYAFFNQIDEVDIAAPLAAEQEAYQKAKAAFDEKLQKLTSAVKEYEQTQLPAAQQRWESSAPTETVWHPVSWPHASAKHALQLKLQSDGSFLVSGENKMSDLYTLEAEVEVPQVRAIRLEVLPDETLPQNGPGRAANGNFVLTTFRAEVVSSADEAAAVDVPISHARADFSQREWDVKLALNENPLDGWAVSPEIGKRHVAVFEFAKPVTLRAEDRLRLTLDQNYEGGGPHNLGRFRLTVTDSTAPIQFEGLSSELAAALEVEADQRTEAQAALVRDYFRQVDPQLAKLKKAVSDLQAKAPEPSGQKAQSVTQRSSARPTHIHLRGDFLSKGDPVEAVGLSVLPPIEPRGERLNRLDFARWLVDDRNPLTPRVTVNRVWQRYFDRGLVATSDDFGKQGELPSHPALLDWLAFEFRESGWRLKHLHRLIVTSATYRQSSASRPELETVDPHNALLARHPRRRVPAEIIRDIALAASGLLDPRVGGPSVRPPQPSEYSQLTYANSAKWKTSGGGDRYRRGLYTFFQRTSPYPMLMTFDAPDSTECTARRVYSNTPLQALTLWNDRVFFECAQHLGRRIVEDSPSPASDGAADQDQQFLRRLTYGFQLCLARLPEAEELDALVEVYQAHENILRENPELAPALLGPAERPANISDAELGAWIAVARVLLNVDEFVTKE